jgi:Spy/CpxP family protein refolding chaperone
VRRIPGVALVVLFAAAVALATDLPDGKWWKRPRLAAEIGLTQEQVREIEKIFVRTRPRLIDLRGELEKRQLALQESMEDHGAERQAVEKQIEAVENARAELQKARALMILDMKQVLQPQQWDRLLQIQQEFRERIEMRRQGLDGVMPEKPPAQENRPAPAHPSPSRPAPAPKPNR